MKINLLYLRDFIKIIAFCLLPITGYCQTSTPPFAIVPTNPVSNGGHTTVFAHTGFALQLMIDESMLGSILGETITSIAFRHNLTSSSSPRNLITYPQYNIYLGKGIALSSSTNDFTTNYLGARTQVRSGVLEIPPGAFSPNTDLYNFNIIFSTPYYYDGGNLIIELQHNGNINAIGYGTPAFSTTNTSSGISFIGRVTNSINNITGLLAFPYIKINTMDKLGVHSLELEDDLQIYPNPVKDILITKSRKQVDIIEIFDASGRLIMKEKGAQKENKINTSELASGTYILKMLYKDGNKKVSKFIKE